MQLPTDAPCWHVALAAELRDPDGRPLQRDRPSGVDQVLRVAASKLTGGFLAAPFKINKSGGVQGLFQRAAGIPLFVGSIADALHPYRWVIGLGFGEVQSEARDDTVVIDGSALDRARAALWTARRDRSSAVAVGFGYPDDATISSLLELMDQIRSRWTERQAATVRAARTLKGKEVAARFGVSPSVVSESLKAAAFRPLTRAEGSLSILLDQFGSEGPWRGENVVYPDILSPLSRESRQLVSRR